MARYYDNQTINDIMARIDIVDIVSETVNLTRKGNRYWGLCPFHEEKTSSFSVTPEKNLFYCFGCHAGGNLFTYIMKRDSLEFAEAVEVLAAKAGVELVVSKRDKKVDEKRKSIIEINKAAAEFYNNILLSNNYRVPGQYIEKRRIKQQTIEKFQIGYAPDKWTVLEDYLLKKGYSEKYIKASGLIKRSSTDRYFDLLRNRIIFPIWRYNGEIVGFGGRVLDDSLPKYLNTSETEIYSKRKNLYGLYQARDAVRRQNEVLLVEGYMDCIKLHQNEVLNSVASLGTAFTVEQAALLRRYAEKVIILYDGDEAGQRETIRAIDILREQNLQAEVITLPGGKDPDEYLDTYGKEEFLHYIKNNKVSYLEFKINRYISQEKEMNIEAQSRVINEVKTDVKQVGSEIKKDYYIKMLAKRLNLEENLVYKEIYVQNRSKRLVVKNKSVIFRDNIKYGNYSLEEKILAAMLKDEQIFDKIKVELGIELFNNSEYREFIFKYNEIQGPMEQRFKQLLETEDEAMNSTIARLEFILEDIIIPDRVVIDNFIRKYSIMKAKKRRQVIYDKLNKLNTEGDFNSIMNFILNLDTVLNSTREGGII